MALGDHAISIYKKKKDKCTRKTTDNYKNANSRQKRERDVCYVGRKRAEKNILMANKHSVKFSGVELAWNLPASAFISSGVSLNATIPRNINPISEPS